MPEKGTLRFARFVVRRRAPIAVLLLIATVFFAYPIVNMLATALGNPLPGPATSISANARDMFPDHPYIHAQDKFAGRFGNASLVAVAVTVEDGDIFNPATLAKIDRITKGLDGWDYDAQVEARRTMLHELEAIGDLSKNEIRSELDERFPPYPVNHDLVRSLTHISTRVVEIAREGGMTAEIFIEDLPTTQEECDERRAVLRDDMPDSMGRLVSRDLKSALITASFVTDRLRNPNIYRAIFDHVQQIKLAEEDANTRIYVTGVPILMGWVLEHAWQILAFIVASVALIFLLLWLYFRRGHGVLIPFVCAGVTVIWGTGFTGWVGIAFDPLVLVIPMIITARAVSHTVQMAERFFEDYERLFPEYADAEQAKIEAASVAMGELIVPGTLGIITDVAGLLVILVTTIPQMRNLGIFGSFWVASIVITVEILHPILICYLPVPKDHRHRSPTIMVSFTDWVGRLTTHAVGKYAIAVMALVVFCASSYAALFHSVIGDANPGTSLFWPDHDFNRAAAEVTRQFGGADTLVVYADGDRDNSALDAKPVRDMERLERELIRQTNVAGTISLASLVKRVNEQFRYGEPKQAIIPESEGAVRGILIQIRLNSPPGALGPMLTGDGRAASMIAFYPDHKGETIERAVAVAERFIKQNPLGQISVRLEENRADSDAQWYETEAIKDFIYYMIGPLLPTRAHALSVKGRQSDGTYVERPVNSVAEHGLPPWIEDFRKEAHARYAEEFEKLRSGRTFTWPDELADWQTDEVDQWWEDTETDVRAVAVGTSSLIVHDRRTRDSAPIYQPTQSWARGVQFVMAGGIMGMLAAVNEEVERSHLANISLIFLVIFLLHSITYRSISSGAIILLQISSATMLSLAYMAVNGLGLNVNTLPVQAVGVGIGVDYAIYIVDRIRQETALCGDIDEAIRRAIRTTGMAVTFTATTVVGGIFFWGFSSLRFQSEMAQLLTVLMVINMVGAITIVPALYSIVRPNVALKQLEEFEKRKGPTASTSF
ncbi:MAG: MMPL family transporter [bacterium]|nr:MMPL family transporter [bacterium]